MIEFIIPLNLPLRAVAITEAFASPPDSIAAEIDRFKRRRPGEFLTNRFPMSESGQERTRSSGIAAENDRDQELEQLRAQQHLFRNGLLEMKNATKLFESRLVAMIHELQIATVELAGVVSAKLIFDEIDADRFPIANLVHEVLARLETSAEAVVRLHPDDLAQLQSMPTIGDLGSDRAPQFIADATLSRGDCKAKAGEVTVVYELKRQIDEIRRQLLSTVDGHAEP